MYGFNDYNSPPAADTDAQTAAGAHTPLAAFREKMPKTNIVITGLLPRREAGSNARVRTLNARRPTLSLTPALSRRGQR